MKKLLIITILTLFTAVYSFGNPVQTVLKKAVEGDPNAQTLLADMYYYGKEVPQNYEQAAFWYKKAAEQGNAKAQYNLGVMYDTGHGVPQNSKKARFWLKKAAVNGHAEL
jgi:uncharacterized protein